MNTPAPTRTVEKLERSTWIPTTFEALLPGDVVRLREPTGSLVVYRAHKMGGVTYREIRDWTVTSSTPDGFQGEPHDFDHMPLPTAGNPFTFLEETVAVLTAPLADLVRQTLDAHNAPNFVSCRLVRGPDDEDPLEVVIRRWTGNTPEQGRRAALARVDELLAKNSELVEEARTARRIARAAEMTRDAIAEKLVEMEARASKEGDGQ